MGLPAVAFPEQRLAEAGFKPEQAEVLLKLMDQKMQNVLTQEYLDLALGRFADQVRQEMKDMKQELKDDIKDVRNELKDVKQELKSDIKDVRIEFLTEVGKVKLDIAERYNRLVLQIAALMGVSIAIVTMLRYLIH